MKLLSIVVPCYNEAESLPCFLKALEETGLSWELVLVDDGSKDGTLALARDLCARDARVKLLSLSRNSGKEAALLAGLLHARGDLVAVMDADMQDPPSLLPQMLRVLRETGCDCVATRRVTRRGEPPVRSFFARAFYRAVNRVSVVRVEDGVRDFRVMRRGMVDALLTLGEVRRFSKGLFAWVGFDVKMIEYENVPRVAGVTKWSFAALFRYALEGIFSLTTAPATLGFWLGGLSALSAILLLIISQYAAALLCGLAAIVLLGLGTLGAYVARVYVEAKARPLYIIQNTHNKNREHAR